MINPVFIIIFNVITGTSCLIFGVEFLSSGLEKANAAALKKVLSAYTGSLIKAFTSGTLLTALVQSSTAVTLITVGLVNSGMINLSNAAGIIYGANIGTTITAQLMSIKITSIGLPVLIIGLFIRITARKYSIRNIGKALVGFGFMFTGLDILNLSVPYIRESQFVYDMFLNYGNNAFTCLIIGMVATMLVHSSAATVGITIVLFNAGLISFDAAIALTLGDNIGTCATSLVAAIGSGTQGQRTAWVHTLYNVIGVIVIIILFEPFGNLVKNVTIFLKQDKTRLVANAHTIFNALSAIVFLPVNKYYIRFINIVVPDKERQRFN